MGTARRPPPPLDAPRLEALALAYVARFATSAGKLGAYLRRKLKTRGWEGEQEPPVEALIARFVAAGYIDDAGFARARGAGLLRRGYGKRRIVEALGAAGIAGEALAGALPDAAAGRAAALAMARKRGFGPFGGSGEISGARVSDARVSGDGDRPLDPARRQKQIAAMLRAGHPLDSARELVDAISRDAAEQWAEE